MKVLLISCLLLSGAATAMSGPDHPFLKPSQYSISTQRLLLQQACVYFTAVRENEVRLDSSLLFTSHSLGLSRLALVTEGMGDSSLLKGNEWFDTNDPGAAFRRLSSLRGIEHLHLLVLLGAYYAFQPDDYPSTKDSALHLLSNALEESRLLNDRKWGWQARILMGKVYAERMELGKSAAVFDRLTRECQMEGAPDIEAKAWMYRGLYTAYSPATTDDRITWLEKARDLYNRQKRISDAINTQACIGYLMVSKGQFKQGESLFKRNLELEDSIGFPFTHYTTDNIAMVTGFEGRNGEPMQFTLRSIRVAEAAKDSIAWGVFYDRLGGFYYLQKSHWPESLRWCQKALDRFTQAGGDPMLYKMLGIIIDIEITTGHAAEGLALLQRLAKLYPPVVPTDRHELIVLQGVSYSALKQYDLAEASFLRAARMIKEIEIRPKTYQAVINLDLGEMYFDKGEYRKARAYLQLFLSSPSIGTDFSTTLTAHKILFTIDSTEGNYISAMSQLGNYVTLLDSSFNVAQRLQAEELGIQYETDKKENEIKLQDQHIHTLVQADLLRQANLRHVEFARNMTIAGIIVLLVIGGLLYRQYQQKQKINQVVTQKNEVITRKNEMLERLVSEKDWLLKEVHHRVKNNLHTVICLLESQAYYLENDALKAMETSQHRIYAMSLIHQKIYQSEDIKTINMANYLPEFVQYLSDSFGDPEHIVFLLDIEYLKLGVSQAVPIALIVNEAVTNSIKYAFPGNRKGQIDIRLHRTGRQIKLTVADNGIGIDPSLINAELNSLGLKLMRGLSREIKGSITIGSGNGTTICVLFEADQLTDFPGLDAAVPDPAAITG